MADYDDDLDEPLDPEGESEEDLDSDSSGVPGREPDFAGELPEETGEVEVLGYGAVTRSLAASFVAAIPLLLVYEAGVLAVRHDVNAAAQFMKSPFGRLQGWLASRLPVDPFWVVGGLLAVGVVIAMLRLRRKGGLSPGIFAGMFAESCVYALLLGPFALLILTGRPQLGEFALNLSNVLGKLVASSGAGLYEELVFRVGLLGLLYVAGHKWLNLGQFTAGALALLISSAIFSAAHFLAPQERISFGVFLYRLVAGVFLGVIFLTRGFGIAAWTHALYDVYVLCFTAHPDS